MPANGLGVRNPYDQSTVVELPYATTDEVSAAVGRALNAWQDWRQLTLTERIAVVRVGLERMAVSAEAIATDVSRQMGKPLTQARGEFQTMLARAEQAMADAPAALAPDELSDDTFVRRIRHEPLGVVLNMAAWNYPLLIPINVIVPALLAGNVVLLKHSARTPLTGQAFANAFGDLAVPDLVTNLILSHGQTETLIADPRVAHVAFTGSVAGGRQIYRAAAERLIDVGLELGGKDPAYVAADADLENAIANLVDGACYNAGQSCCAVERAYVHESLYEDFIAGCARVMNDYVLGDPLAETTTLGPLASRDTLDLLDRQVADGLRRGARLVCGGRRWGATPSNFYEPTLLVDLPNDAEAMQEETFGPLLAVQSVPNDEVAIARMNDNRFGLTASVWTADLERAERMAPLLNAGTIFRNRCDYIDPRLPWTGWGESGKGSTLSRFGFYHLTRRKAIHFRR